MMNNGFNAIYKLCGCHLDQTNTILSFITMPCISESLNFKFPTHMYICKYLCCETLMINLRLKGSNIL